MSNTIPTIPEDSIHPPQSSNPDPAMGLRELDLSNTKQQKCGHEGINWDSKGNCIKCARNKVLGVDTKQQIEEMISDFGEDSISYGEELHTGRVKSDEEIKSDSAELLRKQTEIAEAIDRLVTEAKAKAVAKFVEHSTKRHNAFMQELLEEKLFMLAQTVSEYESVQS